MIERHWDGIAAYCRPENKVSLGFVEGLDNKIRVIQRRAYRLRNEEYRRLKLLTVCCPLSNTLLAVGPLFVSYPLTDQPFRGPQPREESAPSAPKPASM